MNDYSFVNDRKISEYNTSENIFIYQYKEFYIILDILISWDKKEEIIRYWYNFQNDNFIKYYRKICTKSEKVNKKCANINFIKYQFEKIYFYQRGFYKIIFQKEIEMFDKNIFLFA